MKSKKYVIYARKDLVLMMIIISIIKKLDNGKKIKYKLEFTDSFRLMSTSSSKLVDNLSEFYSKNVEIENVNLSVSLKGLKITDFLVIGKSV